jgi:hypothetical protein
MQTAHGFVDNSLGGIDKRRVIFFGGLNRLVAQQELDRSDIRPAGQKRHGEGITEAMRMAITDARQAQHAIEGTTRRAGRATDLSVAAPKEIRGLDRQRCQGFQGILGKTDVKRFAGLHHADHQFSGARVEARSFQLDGVGDSESGIEEGINQSAGAEPGALNAGGVIVIDQVASLNHPIDFLGGERHRRPMVDRRRAQFLGRVLGGPISIGTEREEGAEIGDFLGRCTGSHGALLAIVGHLGERDRVGPAFGREKPFQMAERVGVGDQSALRKLAGFAIGEVAVDGGFERGRAADHGDRSSAGIALQLDQSRLSQSPAPGLERVALALTVAVLSVEPDRAVAFHVAVALFAARFTGLHVASVEVEHGLSIQQYWYVYGTRIGCGPQVVVKLAKILVDLVGFEPTTSSMPWKRAPNCATGPRVGFSPHYITRFR